MPTRVAGPGLVVRSYGPDLRPAMPDLAMLMRVRETGMLRHRLARSTPPHGMCVSHKYTERLEMKECREHRDRHWLRKDKPVHFVVAPC